MKILALILATLLWCLPARADIALSGTVGTGCHANSSPFTIASFAVTAGDLVLLSLHARNEVIVWAITDDGAGTGTWTQRANIDQAQGFIGVETWSMLPGSTETITITIDDDVGTNNQVVYAIAQAFSGVDTATNDGIEAISSTVGPLSPDDNDMLWSVTTLTANAWAVATGTVISAGTLTVEAGVETAIQINFSGCSGTMLGSMWYQGPIATPGATQLGYTDDLSSAKDWCETVVSLKPSGGAPPPATPQRALMGVGQ